MYVDVRRKIAFLVRWSHSPPPAGIVKCGIVEHGSHYYNVLTRGALNILKILRLCRLVRVVRIVRAVSPQLLLNRIGCEVTRIFTTGFDTVVESGIIKGRRVRR